MCKAFIFLPSGLQYTFVAFKIFSNLSVSRRQLPKKKMQDHNLSIYRQPLVSVLIHGQNPTIGRMGPSKNLKV